MRRFGMMIKAKPEKLEEYKRLHADPWKEINDLLYKYGFRNFSIFEKDFFLFGYLEFIGKDIQETFKALSKYKIYQEWLAVCDPCQEPLNTRKEGEWWAFMEEIYHLES